MSLFVRCLMCTLLIGCGDDEEPPVAASGDIASPDEGRAPEPDVPAAEPDVPDEPIDPFAGPDKSLYDCTDPLVPPASLSPNPVSCPLNPECTAPLIVGHRASGGFGTLAPENSRAAIRAALWMGVDGVELDVRHTSDDELVVIHDSDVDRTTTGTGKISDMTLAQVTGLALLATNELGQAIEGDFSCETVPTLTEAFELTRDKLFIDLDTKTSRIDLVVAAIQAADLHDQVYVSVSNTKRAAEARALDPNIRVQVRPDTPEELAEALALFDRPPEILEIPEQKVDVMAPLAADAGAAVFSNAFEQDALARLIGADAASYLGLIEKGVQILQTDFPMVALRSLQRL